MNRGIYVARADEGVPRRAIDGEKTEAGFARKGRRATAVAATGGAQAPGAEAHSAEDSESDDFDEKQQPLLKKQHAAVRQNKCRLTSTARSWTRKNLATSKKQPPKN